MADWDYNQGLADLRAEFGADASEGGADIETPVEEDRDPYSTRTQTAQYRTPTQDDLDNLREQFAPNKVGAYLGNAVHSFNRTVGDIGATLNAGLGVLGEKSGANKLGIVMRGGQNVLDANADFARKARVGEELLALDNGEVKDISDDAKKFLSDEAQRRVMSDPSGFTMTTDEDVAKEARKAAQSKEWQRTRDDSLKYMQNRARENGFAFNPKSQRSDAWMDEFTEQMRRSDMARNAEQRKPLNELPDRDVMLRSPEQIWNQRASDRVREAEAAYNAHDAASQASRTFFNDAISKVWDINMRNEYLHNRDLKYGGESGDGFWGRTGETLERMLTDVTDQTGNIVLMASAQGALGLAAKSAQAAGAASVGSKAASAGLTALGRSLQAGFVASEYQGAMDEARDLGISPAEAAKYATQYGVVAGVLENAGQLINYAGLNGGSVSKLGRAVFGDKVFNPASLKTLGGFAKAGGTALLAKTIDKIADGAGEGLEEVSQTTAQGYAMAAVLDEYCDRHKLDKAKFLASHENSPYKIGKDGGITYDFAKANEEIAESGLAGAGTAIGTALIGGGRMLGARALRGRSAAVAGISAVTGLDAGRIEAVYGDNACNVAARALAGVQGEEDVSRRRRLLEREVADEDYGNNALALFDYCVDQARFTEAAARSGLQSKFVAPQDLVHGWTDGDNDVRSYSSDGISIIEDTANGTLFVMNEGTGQLEGVASPQEAIDKANKYSIDNQVRGAMLANRAQFIRDLAARFSPEDANNLEVYDTAEHLFNERPEIYEELLSQIDDETKEAVALADGDAGLRRLALNQLEAFTDTETGRIVLCAEKASNPWMALTQLSHEGIHAGLLGMKGNSKAVADFLRELDIPKPDGFDEEAAKGFTGLTDSQRNSFAWQFHMALAEQERETSEKSVQDGVALEETIVGMFEDRFAHPGAWAKIQHALYQTWRKVNPKMSLREADMAVLVDAWRHSPRLSSQRKDTAPAPSPAPGSASADTRDTTTPTESTATPEGTSAPSAAASAPEVVSTTEDVQRWLGEKGITLDGAVTEDLQAIAQRIESEGGERSGELLRQFSSLTETPIDTLLPGRAKTEPVSAPTEAKPAKEKKPKAVPKKKEAAPKKEAAKPAETAKPANPQPPNETKSEEAKAVPNETPAPAERGAQPAAGAQAQRVEGQAAPRGEAGEVGGGPLPKTRDGLLQEREAAEKKIEKLEGVIDGWADKRGATPEMNREGFANQVRASEAIARAKERVAEIDKALEEAAPKTEAPKPRKALAPKPKAEEAKKPQTEATAEKPKALAPKAKPAEAQKPTEAKPAPKTTESPAPQPVTPTQAAAQPAADLSPYEQIVADRYNSYHATEAYAADNGDFALKVERDGKTRWLQFTADGDLFVHNDGSANWQATKARRYDMKMNVAQQATSAALAEAKPAPKAEEAKPAAEVKEAPKPTEAKPRKLLAKKEAPAPKTEARPSGRMGVDTLIGLPDTWEKYGELQSRALRTTDKGGLVHGSEQEARVKDELSRMDKNGWGDVYRAKMEWAASDKRTRGEAPPSTPGELATWRTKNNAPSNAQPQTNNTKRKSDEAPAAKTTPETAPAAPSLKPVERSKPMRSKTEKPMTGQVRGNRVKQLKAILDARNKERPITPELFRNGKEDGLNPNGLTLEYLKDLYDDPTDWHMELGLPRAEAEAVRDTIRSAYEDSYASRRRGKGLAGEGRGGFPKIIKKINYANAHPERMDSLALAQSEVVRALSDARSRGDDLAASIFDNWHEAMSRRVEGLTAEQRAKFEKELSKLNSKLSWQERKGRVSTSTEEGGVRDIAVRDKNLDTIEGEAAADYAAEEVRVAKQNEVEPELSEEQMLVKHRGEKRWANVRNNDDDAQGATGAAGESRNRSVRNQRTVTVNRVVEDGGVDYTWRNEDGEVVQHGILKKDQLDALAKANPDVWGAIASDPKPGMSVRFRRSPLPSGVNKQADVIYPDAGREISGARFRLGTKRRDEYGRILAKHRPDLDAAKVLDEIEKFDNTKKEKVALHWVVRGGITLPEDSYKIDDALSVADKAKVDPFQYKSPDDLLLANKEFKPTARPTDPATVPELSDPRDEGDGIVSYLVQDDRDGQKAMRRIIDTHWGEDANPWCLLARSKKQQPTYEFEEWMREMQSEPEAEIDDGEADDFTPEPFNEDELAAQYEEETGKPAWEEAAIWTPDFLRWVQVMTFPNSEEMWSEQLFREYAPQYEELFNKSPRQKLGELDYAWDFWNRYSALPKRVAFKDGKLLAFMATDNESNPDMNLLYRMFGEEYESDADEWRSETGEEPTMSFRDWLDETHPSDVEENNIAQAQWWDRTDTSHPDLDWARGASRFRRSTVPDTYRDTGDNDIDFAIEALPDHVSGASRNRIAQIMLRAKNDPEGWRAYVDSLPSASDRRWAESVAAGDWDAAQRVVDAFARGRGYEPTEVYHGTGKTDKPWFTFESLKGRKANWKDEVRTPIFFATNTEFPMWFRMAMEKQAKQKKAQAQIDAIKVPKNETPDEEYARMEKENAIWDAAELTGEDVKRVRDNTRMIGAYLNFGKMFNSTKSEDVEKLLDGAKLDGYQRDTILNVLKLMKNRPAELTEEIASIYSNWEIMESPAVQRWLADNGYDSYIGVEMGEHTIGIYDNTRIKSSDVATFDDAGEIIPPSRRFDKTKSDIRFMRAGVRGAERLGITNLANAERMEKEGAGRTEIWKKTGWWRAKDGKWRVEIPDISIPKWKAEWLKEQGRIYPDRQYKLGEIVSSAELFAAYPELKDMPLQVTALADALAAYEGREKGILLERDIRADKMASVLTHEIQHAIQDLESLARGGNQHEAQKIIDAESDARRNERQESLKSYRAAMSQAGYDTWIQDKAELVRELYASLGADRYQDAVLRAFLDTLQPSVREKVESAKERYDSSLADDVPKQNAYEVYRSFAGEVEARDAQTRLNMTPEERAATPPWETEDVPEDKQIVRFRRQTVTPEQDAAYMDAVQRGDMETAQRMVREAARRAGYNHAAYHGTPFGGWSQYDFSRGGMESGNGRGVISLTSDRGEAEAYAKSDSAADVSDVMFKVNNILAQIPDEAWSATTDIGMDGERFTFDSAAFSDYAEEFTNMPDEEDFDSPAEYRKAAQDAEREGYFAAMRSVLSDMKGVMPEQGAVIDEAARMLDNASSQNPEVKSLHVRIANAFEADATPQTYGRVAADAERAIRDGENDGAIIRLEDGTLRYFVKDSSQIKSADPVTRDDAGNVIPLSERFNEANPDIRFRRATDTIATRGPISSVESILASRATAPTANPGIMDRTETFMDRVRRNAQDAMLPVKNIEDELHVAPKDSVYLAEDSRYGKDEHQTRELLNNTINPIIDEAQRRNVALSDVSAYLLAKHAPERNQMIRDRTAGVMDDGAGISDQQAKDILKAYDDAGMTANLDAVAQMVWAMNRATLDRLVSAGLLSQTQADTWKRLSPHYVPLRTMLEEDDDRSVSAAITRLESKHALGRSSLPSSPLIFSFLQAEQAIARANKNAVRQKLAALVRAHPEMGRVISEQPRTRALINGQVKYVKDKGFTEKRNLKDNGRANVVQFKEGGDLKYIELKGERGELIARAVTKYGMHNLESGIGKLAMDINRWLANTRTSWAPSFLLRNVGYDTQQVLVLMNGDGLHKESAAYLKNLAGGRAFKTALQYFKDGTFKGELADYMKEYVENGGLIKGGTSQGWGETVDLIQERVAELERKGASEKARKVMGKLATANSAVEVQTRLAVYAAMRAAGHGIEESIAYSRDITVNFNRKGEYGQLINTMFMFANASIQDMERIGRTLFGKEASRYGKNSKVALMRTIGTLVALGFLQGLANYLGGDDDDDEDMANISEYNKQSAWNVKLGKFGMYARLGRRGAYALLPYLGTKLAEVFCGKAKAGDASLDIAEYAFGLALDPLNSSVIMRGEDGRSVAIADSVANALSPTLIAPLTQIVTDRTFTGEKLTKNKWDRNLPNANNGRERTASWYKYGARAINAATGGDDFTAGFIDPSPEVLELLLTSIWGGVGSDALRTLSTASDIFTEHTIHGQRTPFLRDFARNVPDNTSRYYEAIARQSRYETSVKGYRDSRDHDKIKAFVKEHPSAAHDKAKKLEGIKKQIKELRELETRREGEPLERTRELRRKLQRKYIDMVGD